jgi:predicted dehydrogenase
VYFYGMDGVILNGPTVTHAGPRALLAAAGERVVRDLPVTGPARTGVDMFVAQVRGDEASGPTAALALEALATVEAGLLSVSENRRIALAELIEGD